MVLSIGFVMGFVGIAIALIIGIMIFGAVDESITCPPAETYAEANESCESAKSGAWVIISILPIGMFFALFMIFGGLEDGMPNPRRLLRKLGLAKRRITADLSERNTHKIEKPKNGICRQILLSIGLAKRV